MNDNVSRPRIYKRLEVTPNDWMKIYERRQGTLVFHNDPKLELGKNVTIIPMNFDTKKELVGLPKIIRSILSVTTKLDPAKRMEFLVTLGEEI